MLPDLESWTAWRAAVLPPPPYAPSGYDARRYLRDLLRIMQGGYCALCLSAWGSELDHDHRTDRVRGLTCPVCNKREAAALHRERQGGPAAHPVIAAYRMNPPAAGTGWLYWGLASPDWTASELASHEVRLRDVGREIVQQGLSRPDELRLFALAFASWSDRMPAPVAVPVAPAAPRRQRGRPALEAMARSAARQQTITAATKQVGPGRPADGDDQTRYALRSWGSTARLCLLRLTEQVPSVVIIWLSTRR